MWLMLTLSALLVGLSLGLLGAGGSILAVPVLMLLLDMGEKLAIQHSLIIVGLISLAGLINGIRYKTLRVKTALYFASTSLPAASLGAYVGYKLPPGMQTIILVAVMLISAFKMFQHKPHKSAKTTRILPILLAGLSAGFITGLVGIGGGFLIVPALILFAGLTMQQALANSLLLIFANAIFAFLTLQTTVETQEIDHVIVLVMVITGVVAVFAGQKISRKLPQQALKKGFSVCIVLLAFIMLYKM